MKQVLVALLGILTIAYISAAEDYYTDDNGDTYSIGLYGERIYDDSGKTSSKTKNKVKFDNQDDFTRFGWELFKKVDTSPSNLVISSLSPHLLLSFIARESTGNTKTEITTGIHSEGPKKIARLVKALKAEESARELVIATTFFVNKDLQNEIKDTYLSHANNSDIDIFFMDFKNPKNIQQKYDKWVQEKTNGVIKGQQLQLDPDSKMVLSSAMAFKGDWLFSFSDVEPGPFNLDSGKQIIVDMMKIQWKKYHYGYLSDNNGEWLSIPYNSTETMIIMLPNKTKRFDDINEFVHNTPATDITDIIDIITESNRPSTLVNITLPKFKIDSAFSLKEPLQQLGIKRIFTQRSEFFPLKNDVPLQVSSATQQTTLEVNEKGSVGASVTKFSIVALSVQAPVKEVNFIVDRPFVAIIVNRLYRIPYFIAKVSDPSRS